MSGFCHLHLHTEYSLLDGAIKIKDLAARLKDMGMTSCAITDHGVMYGAVSFYREMKANGMPGAGDKACHRMRGLCSTRLKI